MKNAMVSKILVVDDNPANLKLVTEVLGFDGFQVLNAPDAEQARCVIEKENPSLILMDIGLPGMDGLTFTRLLKGNPTTRHIVIVALTAFAMRGDEEKALAVGCDGYIAKPIDTRRISEQVAYYLNGCSFLGI